MAARKKQTIDVELTPELIGEVIFKANRPLKLDEILAMLNVKRQRKRDVEFLLHALVTEGRLIRSRGTWFPPKNRPLAQGILSIQRSGAGFVIPENGSSGDIFIAPQDVRGAWDGDLVEVMLMPHRQGPSREGRITRVIERSQKAIAVHAIRKQDTGWIAAPQHTGLQALFLVDVSGVESKRDRPVSTSRSSSQQKMAVEAGLSGSGSAVRVRENDLLLIQPLEQLGPNLWSAKAIMNLYNEEKPVAQELLAKIGHGIPMEFPPAVLNEAGSMPENPGEDELADPLRQDLRHLPFVTIDGADAKDFDDAIYVEQNGTGYRLLVGIADVSHYVDEGSAIDNEARRRGNSYYFPLSVEPMLPEVLSNGLCSLRPNSPRLAVVADIVFSAKGHEASSTFYTAVIESKARLTYDQVFAAIIDKDTKTRESMADHVPMLAKAFELAGMLSRSRSERGSLDFNLPEAQFVFDEAGDVGAIVPRQSTLANNLIEEFMIAANEAVARFLTARNKPLLYRIHEAPDMEKLESLKNFILQTRIVDLPHSMQPNAKKRPGKGSRQGFSQKKNEAAAPSPQDFKTILQAARGKPQEYTVSKLLLRAMMQAQYSPDNEGHFGLASLCYCHFTSPIRRYADLIVHRSLKSLLAQQGGTKKQRRQSARHAADAVPAKESGHQTVRTKAKVPAEEAVLYDVAGEATGQAGKKAKRGSQNRKADKTTSAAGHGIPELEQVAKHINQTERSAMDAERETHKRLSALYLRGHIGEEFDGIVSGVTDFGIFVELPSCLSEGMIRLSSLAGDYYIYIPERQMLRGERTGRTFSIGQEIRVVLLDVSLQRFEINLEPVEEHEAKQKQAGKRPSGGKKQGKSRPRQTPAGRKTDTSTKSKNRNGRSKKK